MAQFTNQATLSYNGVVANSNIVTGEITQVLSLWKDATVSSYTVGDIVTYAVSIQNSGTTDFNGLTLTDDLGAYTFETNTLVPLTYTGDPVLYYTNGILQATPATAAGPPLVISGINIPAGYNAMIIYRTRVNNYAPLAAGSTIENTATLSGGITENITATETVTINAEPFLNIIKSMNPTTVVENGQLAYTFTIQNTGTTAADAAAAVNISDTFNPPLNNISVTLNGTPWPQEGNYTYDETTGAFATVAGQITVPAAAYTQDTVTGIWSITPGVTTLTVTGTV